MKRKMSVIILFILVAAFIGSTGCIPGVRKTVVQWEFDPLEAEDAMWSACQGTLQGTRCLKAIRVIKRVNGKIDNSYIGDFCCWQCEQGLGILCQRRGAWPGKVIRIDNKNFTGRNWCDNSRASDFRGDNLKALKAYLDWLVREFGYSAGLDIGDVKLSISNEYPPPTVPGEPGKIMAGTVLCPSGSKYIIVIYEHSFTGKTVAEIYNTIAHEFKHVLQIIEQGLDCEHRTPPLEDEADRWAESVAPLSLCN